jgi:hypothetical protein
MNYQKKKHIDLITNNFQMVYNLYIHLVLDIKSVTTLTLGLRPRQGLQGCRPRGKHGSHILCSRECRKV